MGYKDVKHAIDTLREKIETHGKLSEDQKKKINYKFRLEWNYNSNSMEGNTLTVEETRSIMVGNVDIHQKPIKDVIEMKGHDEVISDIIKIGKGQLRLSEKRIKDIHSGIMYEDNEDDRKKIGQWKAVNNYIINRKGERYDFLSHEEVVFAIHDLLNRTNADIDMLISQKKNAKHPIDIAFQFHLEFLNIHPFYDGNGRTARILTNLILIAFGYPPFWITEKERDSYYSYLADIQGYGGSVGLLDEYMANLILRSQQLVMDAIEGKDIEGDDDLQKEISILKRQLEGEKFTKSPKIFYEIFQHSEANIWPEIEGLLNSFNDFFDDNKTFRYVNHIKELVEKQTLAAMFQSSKHPDTPKIFGHDIYETDIFKIKWENRRYGLKNAKNVSEYTIAFNLLFDAKSYSIDIEINDTPIFELYYAYNEFPDKVTIKELKKVLGKKLLENIKSSIKN
ncbi:Fic family protein [Flavobacterium sp. DGU11]|uniref:Fic family protein n=1 Tax=Flavobacterium arundinis TaxID=3139143 RepID=A0ABU9HYK5_9FLAO